jgi:hypothetical protein
MIGQPLLFNSSVARFAGSDQMTRAYARSYFLPPLRGSLSGLSGPNISGWLTADLSLTCLNAIITKLGLYSTLMETTCAETFF